MSSSRRHVSKKKSRRVANRKVRRSGNAVTAFSAVRDSMRSGRRRYGAGVAA